MCTKLDEWLTNNCGEYGQLVEFTRQIKVTPPALDRYRKGDRIPNRETMPLIYLATDGAVTPNDFYVLPDLKRRRTAA